MKTILFALMTLTSMSAFGRLGETFDQCVKRYGTPFSKEVFGKRMTASFAIEGITITCFFTDQECRLLYYAPIVTTRTASTLGELPFTLAQQTAMRDLNKGASEWEAISEDGFGKRFRSADGSRFACISGDRVIVEMASEVRDRQAMLKEETLNEVIKRL